MPPSQKFFNFYPKMVSFGQWRILGALVRGPPWPDRRDFCNYFGIILAPFRDKIAATSDQMRFL